MEGPVGPHLFRLSQQSSSEVNLYNDSGSAEDFYLSMSPPVSPEQYRAAPIAYQPEAEIPREQTPRARVPLHMWTPHHVTDWMRSTGFDQNLIEQFFTNDISGTTLIDLQYEDLKELGITSFGQRHRLWNEIRSLKGSSLNSIPPTPVERPCYSPPIAQEEHRPENYRHSEVLAQKCTSPPSPDEEQMQSPTSGLRRARRLRRGDDVISPAESASIVAIEQLLPKPHKCSKGENCSKWQKQQRKLARIATEYPLELQQITEFKSSPVSTVVPSVVASSDLLGPAQYPPVRLQEDNLRVLQSRDPQENVRQFLSFQHMDRQAPEEPTTPPYEMFPPLSPPVAQAPHSGLRALPKLTIPDTSDLDSFPTSHTARPYQRGTPITAMEIGNRPYSHDIYRLASPASEMDVPVTAIPSGPIERDVSSSVPPDMRFGASDPIARSSSRLGNRGLRQGFNAPLPNGFTPIQRSYSVSGHRRQPSLTMPRVEETRALSPVEAHEELTPIATDINHAGWMKKRKTKMLRHEWHENHFRLKGTQLAMHKDEKAKDPLECIDVDDYAVACSTLNSGKINAAFKSLKLSGKKKDGDPAAFAFQLVPTAEKKGVLSAATGKTHHFAVKTGNERIDWMRELMLAKALKQKGEGYQVNVNGKEI